MKYKELVVGFVIGYFCTNLFGIPLPSKYFWFTFLGSLIIFGWIWLSWRRINEDIRS